MGKDLFTDTIPRLRRASDLLSTRKKWDAPDLSEIFSKHEDGPATICRHLDSSEPESLRIMTIAGCASSIRAEGA
ncbi:MAG: hypothetical protein JRJ09_16020 [Deltaproteobacteria bacterium]|nr:hypothetical protein [Deltaproteobacteria bacterium]